MMRLGSCVLAGVVLIGGAVFAATGDALIVTGDGVNVRFEPSTDSRIRMRVYRNQQVIEIERRGDWVRAEIGGTSGQEGWIHGSLLAPPGGEELAPPPGAEPEPAEDTAAVPEPAEDTAAVPEPPEDTGAAPEPAEDTAAVPEPPEDTAAAPEPSRDAAAAPEVPPAPRATAPSEEATVTERRPAQDTAGAPQAAPAPRPSAPADEVPTHVEAATDMAAARPEAPTSTMPEPAAGPEAADLAGVERFRESVDYLNSRAREVAGVDLFTGVESAGGGVVQVVATEAWSTVPPAGRRSYLNTLYDRWAAAKGGGSVSVQIVDQSGEVVMEKTEP